MSKKKTTPPKINRRPRKIATRRTFLSPEKVCEAARLAVKGTLQKTGHPMTGWLLLPPIGARVRVVRDRDSAFNKENAGRDAVGLTGLVHRYDLVDGEILCALRDPSFFLYGPDREACPYLDEIEPADAPAV